MSSKTTKVLFLITKGNYGGAQRYVYDLATGISTKEFEPVVAFGEGETLGLKLSRAGVRTIRIPALRRDIGLLSEFRAFFAILDLIKAERPNVLHLNSSKAGFVGALAGRYAGVPRIIFTAHNWASNDARYRVLRRAFKLIHWLTILLSHVTIAVSFQTRNDMADMPKTLEKMRVIYNGVEPFVPNPKATARHLIAPQIHEGVWIGTVSELNRNKGVDIAIRAFAPLARDYRHIAFVVIGDGEERQQLEKLARDLGIEEKVRFLGFIPDAHIVLPAFDIFTLTSRTEAFPYAILEAGLSGAAVVASRVGGIPEVIAHRYNGILVEPGDTAGVQKALHALIEHPERRTLYGSRLTKRVGNKFAIERMIAETAKLYQT